MCLHYVPSLRSEVIEKIQNYKPSLAALPYLSLEQQIQLVTQVLQHTTLIDSVLEELNLHIRLARFQPIAQVQEYLNTLLPLFSKYDFLSCFPRFLYARPEFSDRVYDYLMSLNPIPDKAPGAITFFNQQQQQTFAQRFLQQINRETDPIPPEIFPYLSSETQKQLLSELEHGSKPIKLSFYLSSILDGLIAIPNYPRLKLLPIILQLDNPKSRIEYLSKILNDFPIHAQKQLHPYIITTFQQTRSDSTYWLTPEVRLIITNHLLTDIKPNLDLLCSMQSQQTKDEQMRVGEHIYHYVKSRRWTIDRIIRYKTVFEACVPYFTAPRVQKLVEYSLAKGWYKYLNKLIPRLTQQQLTHIHEHITQFSIWEAIEFYSHAHKYHQILDQEHYYQSLISLLETDLPQHTFMASHINILNSIAEDLRDHDITKLYHQNIKIMCTPFRPPHATTEVIRLARHTKKAHILTLANILQFLRYAEKQQRFYYFHIACFIIPPYLETLEPEQAQQLASQINHSIEQITTCWP